MSWEFYKNSKPKARKEYDCDWKDYLEMWDIVIVARPSIGQPASVNYATCLDLGFTDDEIKTIEQYISEGFKIKKGEMHSVTSGKTEGVFMVFRGKIEITHIINKYDLYED